MYSNYLWDKINSFNLSICNNISLKYFENLKLISDKHNAEGNVYTGILKGEKMVLKCSKNNDEESNRRIYYEFLISNLGLQKTTVSEYFCPALFTFKDKEIFYTVYKFIPGHLLRDYNLEDIYTILTLICFIITCAFNEINFTHYDLHTENIMILHTPNKVHRFCINDQVYTIKCDYTPIIFDYGFSHFSYQNVHFGLNPFDDLNITQYKSDDSFDIFKLVLNLVYDCNDLNKNKIKEKIQNINLNFFINIIGEFYYLTPKIIREFAVENHKDFHCPVGINTSEKNGLAFAKFLLRKNLVDYEIKENINLNRFLREKYNKFKFNKESLNIYNSQKANEYLLNELKEKIPDIEYENLKKLINEKSEVNKKNDELSIITSYNNALFFLQKINEINLNNYDINNETSFYKLNELKDYIPIYENYILEAEKWNFLKGSVQFETTLHKSVITNLKNKIQMHFDKGIYDLLTELEKKGGKIDYLKELSVILQFNKSIITKTEMSVYEKLYNYEVYIPPISNMQIMFLANHYYDNLLKLLRIYFHFTEKELKEMLSKKLTDESIIYELCKNQKENKENKENKEINNILVEDIPKNTSEYKILYICNDGGNKAEKLCEDYNLLPTNVYYLDINNNNNTNNIHKVYSLNKKNFPFINNSFNLIILDTILQKVIDTDEFINESYRTLKIGGKLIIVENDIEFLLNKLLNDLYLSILHFIKNKKIDTSYRWYRSQKDWSKKCENVGFKIVSKTKPQSFNKIYTDVFTKEDKLYIQPVSYKYTNGYITSNFPKAPYFYKGKTLFDIQYENLKELKYPKTHWGQRKLLISEIDFLNRLSKNESYTVVYAGSAPGTHIIILTKMFPNIEFHLYDPRRFSKNLKENKKIKINKYSSTGFFTNEVAEKYSSVNNLVFISDIRLSNNEENIMKDQEMQKNWIQIMKPILSMVKFKVKYPKNNDYNSPENKYIYLGGLIRLQCWAPSASCETRLIIEKNAIEKEYNSLTYEQNMSWYNIVLRNYDFSNYYYPQLETTLKNIWNKEVSFDYFYETNVLIDYLRHHKSVEINNLKFLIHSINEVLINEKNFDDYLKLTLKE
jgi:ubiquinone/menaquinone biosynthesis C-methylase UbiE